MPVEKKTWIIRGTIPFQVEIQAETEQDAHTTLEAMKVCDWIEDAYDDIEYRWTTVKRESDQ